MRACGCLALSVNFPSKVRNRGGAFGVDRRARLTLQPLKYGRLGDRIGPYGGFLYPAICFLGDQL